MKQALSWLALVAVVFQAAMSAFSDESPKDSDGDGLPDEWELKYGLDPFRNNGLLAFGTGKDGALTIPAGQTTFINEVRAFAVDDNVAGATSLTVNSTTGFKTNDLAIIICSQDPESDANKNVAGLYEFRRIVAVQGSTLTTDRPLSAEFVFGSGRKIQVQRVPEYTSVQIDGTVTCKPWDGSTGGIIAFLCSGSVTFGTNGRITADGTGYRGGRAFSSRDERGGTGEGTMAYVDSPANNNLPNLHGGGGAGQKTASGGGGGLGSKGENGSGSISGTQNMEFGIGAPEFGSPNLVRLFFGGGGGASGATDYGRDGAPGGNGGGIVIISANSFSGDGAISSNGTKGGDGHLPTPPSGVKLEDRLGQAGGGGAGGSIYLIGDASRVAKKLQVGGGAGGEPGTFEGLVGPRAGKGGDGRIRADLPDRMLPPDDFPLGVYVGKVSDSRGGFGQIDSDGDGLSDYDEFVSGTNPVQTDSDGDGIPDGWEERNGTDPLNPDDSLTSVVGDRLNNYQKFTLGVNPKTTDTDGDGVSDFDEVYIYGTDPLKPDSVSSDSKGIHYSYDKNDRLVGAEYSSGLVLAYQYDANGNIRRQATLLQDTNGLPTLWRFLSGLTNGADASHGVFGDVDGDGWSNYQEWKAGTNPLDPKSQPRKDPTGKFPQTPPMARILPEPNSGLALATNQILLWDAEGNTSGIELQFLNPTAPSSTWTTATVLRTDGSVPGRMTGYPTGVTHSVVWDAASALGVRFKGLVQLRARASDVSSTGPWSEPMTFQVDVTNNPPRSGTLQFSQSSYQVNEGAGSIALVVTRADGSVGEVGVDYATSNIKVTIPEDRVATEGQDYLSVKGTLTWRDGDASAQSITVRILEDSVAEAGEGFSVTLSSQAVLAVFSHLSLTWSNVVKGL